jgi:hypothetical protein
MVVREEGPASATGQAGQGGSGCSNDHG